MRALYPLIWFPSSQAIYEIILFWGSGGVFGVERGLVLAHHWARQHPVRVTQEFNQRSHRPVCLIRSSTLSWLPSNCPQTRRKKNLRARKSLPLTPKSQGTLSEVVTLHRQHCSGVASPRELPDFSQRCQNSRLRAPLPFFFLCVCEPSAPAAFQRLTVVGPI